MLLHLSLSTLLVEKWLEQCPDRKKVIENRDKLKITKYLYFLYLFLSKGDILHFFYTFDKFEIDF